MVTATLNCATTLADCQDSVSQQACTQREHVVIDSASRDGTLALLQSRRSLGQRHKDIAHSVQAMYEEAFFHLLNMLHSRRKLDAVAVAGGCGMNSVASGKIRLRTPFKRV